MAKSTMSPASFNIAGQFGLKPKVHLSFEELSLKEKEVPKEKERVEEEILKSVKGEIVEGPRSTQLEIDSFMCPNCDAEFDYAFKLKGHMQRYATNK